MSTYTIDCSTVYNGGNITGGIASDTITLTTTGAGSSHTILGGAGTSTPITLSNGTNYTTATNWASPNTVFSAGNGKPVMTVPVGGNTVQIEKEATLDVKGSIVINGVDLEERLNVIEQILNIPTRDVTMESKYPKLKALYEEYMHELEKYKTWDKIKGE